MWRQKRNLAQPVLCALHSPLREQLAPAELGLYDAVSDQFGVEGVLAFAEHLLWNAARLWIELGLDQRQELQQVLLPQGLGFDGSDWEPP